MQTNKIIFSGLAILLVVIVGSFYMGIIYGGKSSGIKSFQNFQANGVGQFDRQNGGVGGQTGMRGGRMQGGFIGGDIISKDDKSVTVKLPDGGSKIIFYSNTTDFRKSVSGSVSDLVVGGQISANGVVNGDGSVTAQMIQIR